MIFSTLSRKEIAMYFDRSFGYQTDDNGYGLYIFSLEKKELGFIFMRSQKHYWTPWFFFNLWLDRKLLNMPFRVEWHRFMMHTHIERVVKRNQLKSK